MQRYALPFYFSLFFLFFFLPLFAPRGSNRTRDQFSRWNRLRGALLARMSPTRFFLLTCVGCVGLGILRNLAWLHGLTSSSRPNDPSLLAFLHRSTDAKIHTDGDSVAASLSRIKEVRAEYMLPSFDWKRWAETDEKYLFLHVGKAGGSTIYCKISCPSGTRLSIKLCGEGEHVSPGSPCHLVRLKCVDFSC